MRKRVFYLFTVVIASSSVLIGCATGGRMVESVGQGLSDWGAKNDSSLAQTGGKLYQDIGKMIQGGKPETTVASAPGRGTVAETIKAQAIVSALDPVNRVITLKTADNRTVEIIAGPEVKNFAQLKVGDKVNVQYARALSLELKKVGAPTRETGSNVAVAAAAAGSKPAAVAGTQITVVADVIAVDAKAQTVTLRGPKGNMVDLKVNDPAQFNLVSVGDKVEATYTEALAVLVEAAM